MRSVAALFYSSVFAFLLCWSGLAMAETDAVAPGEIAVAPGEMEDAEDSLHGLASAELVTLPNNFRDVETWNYPSGLRVYFKSMPKVANVYVTASLPVGSALDPPGLEGLAHFVEHMVFTDHRGKTEQEIKQAVLDRGGRKNATTTRYMTRYYVDVPASEWRFGVNWLHDLLTGHSFTPAVANEERKVVMLEKSRRESTNLEALDQLQAWLRGNKLLVYQDFWEREFGLEREHRGVVGTYASLGKIGAADLQRFYDQYYGPQNVTVMIVGNVSRAAVKELVGQTFGAWPRSGELVDPNQPAVESDRLTQRIQFSNVKNVDHRIRYKLYSPSETDVEMAYFTARFLRHLLNQRLRLEHKATYGVSVDVETYAGHAVLGITGNYDRDALDQVDGLIHSVLDELKAGQMDAAQFENFRDRAVGDLYMGYQTASSIANWCNVFALCNKQIYQEFPDKIGRWQDLSQVEFSGWLSDNLLSSRKVVELTKPYPVSLLVQLLCAFAVVLLVFHGLRWRWKRPVDMTEIRYLSNIRYPLSLVLVAALLAAALALGLSLLAFDGYQAIEALATSVDSYPLQFAVKLVLLAGAAAIILAVPAYIPRKLLLFSGGWRLKFWSFRSSAYGYGDIREIRECSFASLLFSRRAFTTAFLHWGLWRKGVYIRVGEHFGYFVRARNNGELTAQFQRHGGVVENSALQSTRFSVDKELQPSISNAGR